MLDMVGQLHTFYAGAFVEDMVAEICDIFDQAGNAFAQGCTLKKDVCIKPCDTEGRSGIRGNGRQVLIAHKRQLID